MRRVMRRMARRVTRRVARESSEYDDKIQLPVVLLERDANRV